MMEKTALGSRSSYAAPAWPNQVKGAALPNGSSPKNLRHRSHSPDITIGTCRQPDAAKTRARSSLPGQSDPRPRSSQQSIPIGHALATA